MAYDKSEQEPEMVVRNINIDCVENGYKVCAYMEKKQKSLAERAGWVPECCSNSRPKEYVEKTKDAVLKRIKEIL